MARLTDLSNELILAVRSHLRKPADILRFALIDRRCYGLITPLLYETINLHHEDYLSINTRYSDRKIQAKILEIMKAQRSSTIRNLEICASLGYDLGYGIKQFNLFRLLPHLTNLTSLHLSILKGVNGMSVFPLWLLPKALSQASGTLKTLVLCIEDRDDDLLPIGSLQKLTALKRLCIQSTVLLGYPSDNEDTEDSDNEDVLDTKRAMASELLPAGLETLEVHCCRDGKEFEEEILAWYVERGKFYACELSLFVGKAVSFERRSLKSVVVCRSLLKGCGKRVRDLRDHLDVVGTKTSHLGVDLKLAKGLELSDAKIVSII